MPSRGAVRMGCAPVATMLSRKAGGSMGACAAQRGDLGNLGCCFAGAKFVCTLGQSLLLFSAVCCPRCVRVRTKWGPQALRAQALRDEILCQQNHSALKACKLSGIRCQCRVNSSQMGSSSRRYFVLEQFSQWKCFGSFPL